MIKAVIPKDGLPTRGMNVQHGQEARPALRNTMGCELAAEVLRSHGSVRLRAMGTSMLPAIWPGDVLTVERRADNIAVPGDIVLFGRGGALVAHRVVARTLHDNGTQWVTRGDSVGGNDARVSRRELLGKVVAIERGFRQFPPYRSLSSRLIAWVLSRSDLATRALLRFRMKDFPLRIQSLGFGN